MLALGVAKVLQRMLAAPGQQVAQVGLLPVNRQVLGGMGKWGGVPGLGGRAKQGQEGPAPPILSSMFGSEAQHTAF